MSYLNGTDAEKADFEERWRKKGLAAIERFPHWNGFEEVKALHRANIRRHVQAERSTSETADAQPPAITSTGVRQRHRLRRK